MVSGEPDVEIKKAGNELTVEIKGVDVYDPTTGQIRNASTDDIACWPPTPTTMDGVPDPG